MKQHVTTPPAPLTVVVEDVGDEHQLLACLRQLVRTSPRSTVIIAVSARRLSLPSALRDRVSRVTCTDADAVAPAAAGAVAAALSRTADRRGSVLHLPSSTTASRGWVEEARTRAVDHPEHRSSLAVAGGEEGPAAVLHPCATKAEDATTPWQDAQHLVITALQRSANASAQTTTVSAVLIVKDEAAVLADCLSALTPLVDEVVVYDTGSTDGTVAIARAHGARTVEGYWDDHFGDARNRALDHAQHEWVLSVDADEVVEGDADALRTHLAGEQHDHVIVPVLSTQWAGATSGTRSFPVRLFRRTGSRWTGALHEYPAPLPGAPFAGTSPHHAPLLVVHSGYHDDVVDARGKHERNRTMALKELAAAEPGGAKRAELVSNLGRTLLAEGRHDEGVAVLDELRTLDGNSQAIVLGGRSACRVLLAQQRWIELEQWTDALAEHGEAPGNLAVWSAQRLSARGELAAAEVVARSAVSQTEVLDPWGVAPDPTAAVQVLAGAVLAQGRPEEAAALVEPLVTAAPDAVDVGVVLESWQAAGRPLQDLAERSPEEFVARSVRHAVMMSPATALAWCEALRLARPADVRSVVLGNVVAAKTGWQESLQWSLHAAEAGVTGVCALKDLVVDKQLPPLDRTLGWGLLAVLFGEAEAESRFTAGLAELPDGVQQQVLGFLADLTDDAA